MHLVAKELKVALVIDFVARVSGEDRQAIVTENLTDDFFLLLGEECRFGTIDWILKAEIDLEFTLAENLDQLFQAPRDIVSIWELIELTLDLFSSKEAQFPVTPHRCIVRISVLVRADKKVNVVP